MAAKTLWDYYLSKGQQLPSVAERREQFNLEPSYKGTAAQNTSLLRELQSGARSPNMSQTPMSTQNRVAMPPNMTRAPINPPPTQATEQNQSLLRRFQTTPLTQERVGKFISGMNPFNPPQAQAMDIDYFLPKTTVYFTKGKPSTEKTQPPQFFQDIANKFAEYKRAITGELLSPVPKTAQPEVTPRPQQSFEPPPAPTATPTPTPTPMPVFAKNPSVQTLQGEQYNTVRQVIKSAAEKYGVDPSLMEDIAFAESSLDPNKSSDKSSAAGLFQFIDKTWNWLKEIGVVPKDASKYDPVANADAAAWALSKGYLSWWNASKHVWGQFHGRRTS